MNNNSAHPTPSSAKQEQATFVEALEGQYLFSLKEIPRVLWERAWIIGLVVLSLIGIAVGLSLVQTPVYQSSIKILIGQQEAQGSEVQPGSLGGEVQGLQQITQTMTEGVNDLPIAEATVDRLGLQMTPEELQANLNAQQLEATQFIQVSYRDTSPERAQQVSNTVGDVFSEQVSEVSPSANRVTATVWERATLPAQPVSPNPVRNGLAGLALGVVLGVALALLLEYRKVSWNSPEEVERITGVPTFAVVPEHELLYGEKEGR